MATTLATLRQELSKEINDYWASTTTSDGNDGGTTLVDTALTDKDADWAAAPAGEDEPTVLVTSGTYVNQERPISTLSSATLTSKRAFGGKIVSAVTYEIHRLFSAADKNNALIFAAKAVFPSCFAKVLDTSFTTGNWLRNGDMEDWASASYPDYWRVATVTAVEETKLYLTKRGLSSAKVTRAGADGYLWTGVVTGTTDLVRDLWELEGREVTFKCWCHAASASQARIAIYDGTTTTYSSYHTGDSVWRELEVTATLADNCTDVQFRCYVAGTNGSVYFDDARVKCGNLYRFTFDFSNLSLYQNRLHAVAIKDDNNNPSYPYRVIRDYEVTSDGILRLNQTLTSEYRLRLEGIGYLSVSSTSSLALDAPQTLIVQARAIQYLFENTVSSKPTQDIQRYATAAQRWAQEAQVRKQQFGMIAPASTILYRSAGG